MRGERDGAKAAAQAAHAKQREAQTAAATEADALRVGLAAEKAKVKTLQAELDKQTEKTARQSAVIAKNAAAANEHKSTATATAKQLQAAAAQKREALELELKKHEYD
jgi:hypothetical protein